MSNPELQKYIKDSRASGHSDEEVRKTLSEEGWKAHDVNKILGEPPTTESPEENNITKNTKEHRPSRNLGKKLLIAFIVLLIGAGLYFYIPLYLRALRCQGFCEDEVSYPYDEEVEAEILQIRDALELAFVDTGAYPIHDTETRLGDIEYKVFCTKSNKPLFTGDQSDCEEGGKIYLKDIPLDNSPGRFYEYTGLDGEDYYLEYIRMIGTQDIKPGPRCATRNTIHHNYCEDIYSSQDEVVTPEDPEKDSDETDVLLSTEEEELLTLLAENPYALIGEEYRIPPEKLTQEQRNTIANLIDGLVAHYNQHGVYDGPGTEYPDFQSVPESTGGSLVQIVEDGPYFFSIGLTKEGYPLGSTFMILTDEFGVEALDNDGLGYADELRYGSDPNDSDSDNDGFTDGEEVAKGFNPAGEGVLP